MGRGVDAVSMLPQCSDCPRPDAFLEVMRRRAATGAEARTGEEKRSTIGRRCLGGAKSTASLNADDEKLRTVNPFFVGGSYWTVPEFLFLGGSASSQLYGLPLRRCGRAER